MIVNPREAESEVVEALARVLDTLLAAALVGMMSRMVTVMLPAVTVTTASLALGN